MTEVRQTAEQKEALAQAKAERPNDEQLRRMAASVPPLRRDAEHSFVDVEQTDVETDRELVQPVGEAAVAPILPEAEETFAITRPDRAKSTYRRSCALSETELETMSDEQIADSGVLENPVSRVHPSRIQHGQRPRQPGQLAPAAGAGSWPVNEGQMPAVMPTDGPIESAEERELAGDNSFASIAGFKETEGGSLKRKGLEIGRKEVPEAASLYLRLRQQFPHFTAEQIADEFEVQWLSGRVGAKQSHRAGDELSTNGLTAVGDDRVEEPTLGAARAKADEAAAEPGTIAPADAPEAGLPSQNEPATTAVDAAKAGVAATDADKTAIKQADKLEDKTTGENAPESKPADEKGEARP